MSLEFSGLFCFNPLPNFDMKRLVLIWICSVCFLSSAFAQIEKPVTWAYRAKRTSQNQATLYLKATMQGSWHIYALDPKPIPTRTLFTFAPSKDFSLVGKPVQPKPVVKYDKTLKANLSYFEHEVVFTQVIKLHKKQTVVKGKVEFMVCNEKSCLPTDEVAFSIPVKP